jgi:hypothetical protein
LQIRRITATGELWLRYTDGTEFLIGRSGGSVLTSWAADLTFEDAVVYLLGPVLGILLRIREWTCLHASVVAVGEWALAFVGPAGAGKSTAAAAFAKSGHEVLSDDILALHDRGGCFWAEPGYSWLRLWPSSVDGLYGSSEALPSIVEGWEKQYLDLAAGDVFCSTPRQIGGIYVIGDRVGSAGPVIRRLPGRSAIMALLANVYVGYLPGAAESRQDFERLSRLVADVPVRGISLPDDWRSLSALPEAVVEDFTAVAASRVS